MTTSTSTNIKQQRHIIMIQSINYIHSLVITLEQDDKQKEKHLSDQVNNINLINIFIRFNDRNGSMAYYTSPRNVKQE